MSNYYDNLDLQGNFLENAKLKKLTGTEAANLADQILFFNQQGNLVYKKNGLQEALLSDKELLTGQDGLVPVRWDDYEKRWVYRSFLWPESFFAPALRVQWIPVGKYLLDTSHVYTANSPLPNNVVLSAIVNMWDKSAAGIDKTEPSITVHITESPASRFIIAGGTYVFYRTSEILEGKFGFKLREAPENRNYYYVSGFWDFNKPLNTSDYFGNTWPDFCLWVSNTPTNELLCRVGLVLNNNFFEITSFGLNFDLAQYVSYLPDNTRILKFNYRILLGGQFFVRIHSEWGERFYQANFVPPPVGWPDNSVVLQQRIRFGVGRFGLSPGIPGIWSNVGFSDMAIWKTKVEL